MLEENIKKKDDNEKEIFKPDYRIAKLSAIGIAGFIVGCIILFFNDFVSIDKNDSVFHEIKYQPREYAGNVITTTIDSLSLEISKSQNAIKIIDHQRGDTAKKPKTEIKKIDPLFKKAKDSLSQKIKADTNFIISLSTYKQYFEDVAEIDDMKFKSLNDLLHFQITPQLINKWDSEFSEKKWNSNGIAIIDTVNYFLKDEKITFRIKGSYPVVAQKADSDIDFITKYPSAGIWLMLILIFCSFCFVAISTAVYIKEQVSEIFRKNTAKTIPKWRYAGICLITLLVMGLLLAIWNRSFYDEDIVKDIFFMKHLNNSMNIVIFLGTFAGSLCMAGFIYTASMLSFFGEPLVVIKNEVAEQKAVLTKLQNSPLTAQTPENLTQQQLLVEQKDAEQKKQEGVFNDLTKKFQTYFILAAIILSLMVLCTGALFSTINSLDFIKLIESDWGYAPTKSDFIYLYGGLYSIILLLVYIPAKMRFSEVDVLGNPTSDKANGKWQNILKSPFEQLKGILIATSPLLVSIIQSLFDAFFN